MADRQSSACSSSARATVASSPSSLRGRAADIIGAVDIAHFLEARSHTDPGPYDVCLVEGSVTTEEEAERIRDLRARSKVLIAIGACATAGGLQGLKNFASLEEYTGIVYPRPEYIHAEDLYPVLGALEVDYELQGCPIDKGQLLGALTALLTGRKPELPHYSVCMECKRRGTVCVLVASNIPCMGPVTATGCGALCPSYGRGCYGCFGPMDTAQPETLAAEFKRRGLDDAAIVRQFRQMNAFPKQPEGSPAL